MKYLLLIKAYCSVIFFISSSLLKIMQLLSRSSFTSCRLFWWKAWGYVVSGECSDLPSTQYIISCLWPIILPQLQDADSASFLILHFSSALGSSILGDLLTGELTGKCHFCKPDLEKHDVAVLLVSVLSDPSELAFMCSQSLWLQAQDLTGFKISWICEMFCL